MSLNSEIIAFFNQPLLTQKNIRIALIVYVLLAPISYHLLPYTNHVN